MKRQLATGRAIDAGTSGERQRIQAAPAEGAVAEPRRAPAPARTPPHAPPHTARRAHSLPQEARNASAVPDLARHAAAPDYAGQWLLSGVAGAGPHVMHEGAAPAGAALQAANPLAPATLVMRAAFTPALQPVELPAAMAAPEIDEAPMRGHGAPDVAGGDSEPYEKRAFHVFRGQDGVQAWVRDAALNPVQARAVAEAMAGQFASAGTVLAALTINGRRVVAAGAGARAADARGQSTASAMSNDRPAVKGVSA